MYLYSLILYNDGLMPSASKWLSVISRICGDWNGKLEYIVVKMLFNLLFLSGYKLIKKQTNKYTNNIILS